jgi:hypothetical protein
MVYRPNTKPSADASNGPLLRSEMKEVDVPATFALEYLRRKRKQNSIKITVNSQ